jgi:hypothetical protein
LNEYVENKRNTIFELLRDGQIQVTINSAFPGVVLPEHLMNKYQVILNLSHKFKDRIHITEIGVTTVLLFLGEDHPVVLPWGSIWYVADEDDYKCLYSLEMPLALREDLAKEPPALVTSIQPELEGVGGGGETTAPRSGHLKLLKN